MILTSNLQPSSYGMAMGLLLVGCLVQSIGVVLEIKPKVAMMSAEAFVKYASRCYNKEFGKFKVYFDVTLVTLAVLISLMFTQGIEGIREGSLYCSLHYRVYRQFPESEDYDEKALAIRSSLQEVRFTLMAYCGLNMTRQIRD